MDKGNRNRETMIETGRRNYKTRWREKGIEKR